MTKSEVRTVTLSKLELYELPHTRSILLEKMGTLMGRTLFTMACESFFTCPDSMSRITELLTGIHSASMSVMEIAFSLSRIS